MRLHDSVAQATEPLRVALDGYPVFTLPNAATISSDVAATPLRYILDDVIAASVVRTAFEDSTMLLKCLDLVRMPAPFFWVEWDERGRRVVMSELGIADPIDAARTTGRAGLLVRSDATGRRGTIVPVWDGEEPEPEISPFALAFDLDRPQSGLANVQHGITRQVIVRNDIELTEVLKCVEFHMHPKWVEHYGRACASPAILEDAIHTNLYMVTADFPVLAAFCLLMMARNAVSTVPVDMARLNKARARNARPPLLDHVEVKAFIGTTVHTQRSNLSSGERSPARMHLVAGHLVRRGAQVFWRRAHLRGSMMRGVISSRTVVVRSHALAA